jgi:mannose-6-phosphate isomerase-like protein (cupin superfamily)
MTDSRSRRSTVATGRPLDERGEPTDGPVLQVDPNGPAADLFRGSSYPLTSSPGARMWSALLEYPDNGMDADPVLLIWLAPNAMELPPHVHTRDTEYFRSLEGELTAVIEGEPHRLASGEDVTIDPGEEHTFRNDTDEFVAFYAELPWKKTAETQFTFCGLDHEGKFGSGNERYGEPGFVYALVMMEYLYDGTILTVLPISVQRLLWATVGRVAKALGHRAVEEKYLRDEFWIEHVEQPEL